MEKTKHCRHCQKTKTLSEFQYRGHLPDSRSNKCKDCIANKVHVYKPAALKQKARNERRLEKLKTQVVAEPEPQYFEHDPYYNY